MSSIVGTQLGWDVRDTALERSLSDKEHIGDPFESVAERAQLPIEMDLLPPGKASKARMDNLFDDGVDRYLGTCRYQSTIDFLSLIWCDPS